MLLVEDSWPPYATKDGLGLSTSIVKSAFAAAGVTPRINVRPYARVLAEVEEGKAHGGYNVTRQHSTEAIYIFGSSPILIASASFYFQRKNKDRYQSIEDIPSGAKIGLIIGYEYGDNYEKLRHRFNEVRVNKQAQIVKMLNYGRIDAAIMFDEVAKYTLNQEGLDTGSIVKGFKNHHSDIYVVFSRKKINSQYFSDLLDQGLKVIRKNGTYQKIINGELR